jgi:hypothetical protein
MTAKVFRNRWISTRTWQFRAPNWGERRLLSHRDHPRRLIYHALHCDKHNDPWRCHGTLLRHPSFEFIVFNPSFELIIFNLSFELIVFNPSFELIIFNLSFELIVFNPSFELIIFNPVFQLYIEVATAKFLIPVFIFCSLNRSDFLTHTIPNCLQIS